MAQWQQGGVCYPTPEAANFAAASAVSGTIQGGSAVSLVSVSPDSIVYGLTSVVDGSTSSVTVAVTPVPCQLIGFEDASAMAWMVAAAWLAVYGVAYIGTYVVRKFTEEPAQ